MNPFAILFLIRLLIGNKAGDSIRRRHLVLAGKLVVHMTLAAWITILSLGLLANLTDDQSVFLGILIWSVSLLPCCCFPSGWPGGCSGREDG